MTINERVEALEKQIALLQDIVARDNQAYLEEVNRQRRELKLSPATPIVDHWCYDCQDSFRALHQPQVHTPPTPCPKCKGSQTYEAWTE